MVNIRTRLIHLLGGVTKKEHFTIIEKEKQAVHRGGKWIALMDTLKVMEDNYGNPDWGDIVHNYVKESIEELLNRKQ